MGKKRTDPPYVERDCGYETPCWVWQWCTDGLGYGHMYHPEKKRSYLAHRYYYEREHGDGPDSLDHLCVNTSCVNPAHLDPCGTGENTRRGPRAKLTWDAVRAIRASAEHTSVLAQRFGVAVPTVQGVRAGRSWREAA